MKKITLIISLITFSASTAFCQVTWEKLFSNRSDDVLRCVVEVTGGSGYVAAGYVSDSIVNDSDAYVVRLDPNGDTIWTFKYNGPSNSEDLFYKVINTSDGGFLALGYTGLAGQEDMLYVKLNSAGQQQWVQTFGGAQKEHGQDVVEVSDGYTIVGYTTSPPAQYFDAEILHVDFNGTVIWNKLIGNAAYDDANTVKVLPDGGYILGGQSTVGTGFGQFLARTNSAGDTIWTKRLFHSTDDNIESLDIINGGYILAGHTHDTTDDGYIVATDTSGNIQWTKTYGGAAQDDFHTVKGTSDGGFILAGTSSTLSFSTVLKPDMWLVKTDSQGNIQWQQNFGGENHDHGYSATETSDGGYILAGFSSSFGFHSDEGYIVKLGSSGARPNALTYITAYSLDAPTCAGTNSEVKVLVRNFGNNTQSNINVTVDITGSITQTLTANIPQNLHPLDAYIVTLSPTINTTSGGTYTFNGFTGIANDVYPARNSFTTTLTLLPCNGIDEIQSDLGFSVYPNPSSENMTLDFSSSYKKAQVSLMNSTGELVAEFTLENTSGLSHKIDLTPFSNGIYLLKVTTEDGYDVRKIFKN